MTFYGTETYAIDHKGRLSIPAGMRRAVSGKTFILVSGFDGCLALYTEEQWSRVEESFQRQPIGDRDTRLLSRMMLMDARRVTVDAQGRVTIPPALIGRAELGKEAVLLGQVGHIEIWNPEKLRSEIQGSQGQFERLAQKVLGEKKE